ncbi:HYR domain-containing protein [Fulvivirga sp. M361]|uniref:T9SS type B sorting domain-containing protein n=1 Tax=Fulvivirga sp. M361 TaxID=2594266 RepID=UPI00117B736A|nr:gliding motility-associated C-terminal domain-containing protein [Fulvivirga sp. M361]TRX60070.1 HYR domain-containing protein [Fulvivirga sp. M361]
MPDPKAFVENSEWNYPGIAMALTSIVLRMMINPVRTLKATLVVGSLLAITGFSTRSVPPGSSGGVAIMEQTMSPPPIFTYVGQGFDVSAAVHASDFSVAGQESDPRGITFSLDGLKMFIIGIVDHAVVEYNLEKAFDVSTAIYAGSSEEFSVADREMSSQELIFNPDGTKMFIIGANENAVIEYDLGIAYDVSTAIYGREFSVANEEGTSLDLAFSSDGLKMFIVGFDNGEVVEYNLGIAYDVSTALYAGASESFSVADQEIRPRGMTFSSDGMKLFIIGSDGRAVVEYSLGIAYDVSTAVYAGASEEFSVVTEESLPQGITFNPDGTKMFIIGSNGDAVVEYTLASMVDYRENGTENVIDIDANDSFGGANDSVTYHLKGADASLFDIDASGAITFNTAPDFEDPKDEDRDNIYVMKVIAENDIGKSCQSIIIHVSDMDDMAPTVITRDITISLDATGNSSITPDQVNSGSFDNVGIMFLLLDKTEFTCADIGTHEVTLTASDDNGNTAQGTALVTVVDDLVPTTVVVQDLKLELDASGIASVTAAQVDNGSSDNCSVASLTLDQTEFDCSHLGTNTVTLTVADGSGNMSSATTTVEVVDNFPPVLSSCPTDITAIDPVVFYDLPEAGDNCSITSTSLVEGLESGSRFPLGVTLVTYGFTDPSGNASTCSFRVIINEKEMTLDIPTAFSPNGDGVNDTWNILNIDRYPNARLRVFDLSGREVFSSISYEREWDGSYRSKILPAASYYYVLDLNVPDDKKLKGKITIIK